MKMGDLTKFHLEQAYQIGQQAREKEELSGKSSDSPYMSQSHEWYAWMDGYHDKEKEIKRNKK